MRLAQRLVVAAGCVVGFAVGPTQPHRPAQDPAFDLPAKLFGIVDANGPHGRSGGDAKELGITLDRIDFDYGESIASMDAKVARDASHGLITLPLLNQYGKISTFDQAGWKKWTQTVVGRYGPDGTFWQGRADRHLAPTYFELLNEPYGFWFYPTPEPAAYANFFANVVTAAKAANPAAKFLLAGSPHTFQDATGRASGQSWDAQLKAAPDFARALKLADGVTTHPYDSGARPLGWSTVLDSHNDFPEQEIWITEVSYRIGETIRERRNVKVTEGSQVTESVQAAWMRRSLNDFMRWPWARSYVWFKWADYGPDNMWGVVRPDGSHRPAYNVFQAFVRSGVR